MKRRELLTAAGGIAGAGALGIHPLRAEEQATAEAVETVAGMPRRVLGRTGEEVSIVGFPGLALIHQDQEECTAAIHQAFAQGVNFFDVAPAYGRGDCERKMGEGLTGIDRNQYFLACKTQARDRDEAQRELDLSLERLKTDHFDLYQMHVLRQPDEVRQALGPGGALEAMVKAREEGKVRFLGFSAHTTRGALEAMRGFGFDTVMFPLNFIEYFTLGFGKAVLDLAAEQGAAVLAIKPMCGGTWAEGAERTRQWWYRPLEEQGEIDMAMRFTLSLPGVVAGFPPAFLDLTEKAIAAGKGYRPITAEENEELRQMAESLGSVFRAEEQKVSGRIPRAAVLYADSPHEGCPGRHA